MKMKKKKKKEEQQRHGLRQSLDSAVCVSSAAHGHPAYVRRGQELRRMPLTPNVFVAAQCPMTVVSGSLAISTFASCASPFTMEKCCGGRAAAGALERAERGLEAGLARLKHEWTHGRLTDTTPRCLALLYWDACGVRRTDAAGVSMPDAAQEEPRFHEATRLPHSSD
ncbi:hypothetical protein F503_00803 [Ophiostoma piceae UAMH 11346]|uniref:Uncharacterized protein n=1 Tax=Ophiostoma piceae (strain UAMH 11346) TaxID=1262450 RepID=S3D3T0_OPHP1|nr:hypothetical protein F503_00803 [Ophiostoma piceae UAMH 11346]